MGVDCANQNKRSFNTRGVRPQTVQRGLLPEGASGLIMYIYMSIYIYIYIYMYTYTYMYTYIYNRTA